METEWIRNLENEENKSALERAGQILQQGGLVAFPTETVYGLGGDAFNPESSRKIYEAKGRPSDNPLIVHICRISDLEKVARDIPEVAYKLADAYWPGPLTMILSKQPSLPKETTGGLETVAVRMPDHPVALALIDAAGGFVAAPSANTSGRPSPTLGKYVYEDLAGRVDMLLDAGQVGIGVESTIVDLTGDVPMILRPGYVTPEMLEEVLRKVELDPALAAGPLPDHGEKTLPPPKAPGMKYKHYAPKGEVTVLEGDNDKVSKRLLSELDEQLLRGRKCGIIVTEEMEHLLVERGFDLAKISVKHLGREGDLEAMAHGLFQFLREFDDEGVEKIYVKGVDEKGLGLAVMNRLKKAAGGKIIEV